MSLFSSSNQEEIDNLRQTIKDLKGENENLKFELKESENKIHAKIGRIEYIKIKHLVNITIYEDQRPLNLENIDKIIEHQNDYFTEVGYFQDNLPFIVAYHPENKMVFRNKSKTGDRT